jgi:hypothetical protein
MAGAYRAKLNNTALRVQVDEGKRISLSRWCQESTP